MHGQFGLLQCSSPGKASSHSTALPPLTPTPHPHPHPPGYNIILLCAMLSCLCTTCCETYSSWRQMDMWRDRLHCWILFFKLKRFVFHYNISITQSAASVAKCLKKLTYYAFSRLGKIFTFIFWTWKWKWYRSITDKSSSPPQKKKSTLRLNETDARPIDTDDWHLLICHNIFWHSRVTLRRALWHQVFDSQHWQRPGPPKPPARERETIPLFNPPTLPSPCIYK